MAFLWFILFRNLTSPDSSVGKESACNVGDPGLSPGSGRSAVKGIVYPLQYSWASLVAQLVKNPPAMQETWVQPWDGKIPWRREKLSIPVFWPGEFHELYSPWGPKRSDMTERFSLHFTSVHITGKSIKHAMERKETETEIPVWYEICWRDPWMRGVRSELTVAAG